MTLFALAGGSDGLFRRCLDVFCGGEDAKTLQRLGLD
jgi:uncharacterized protein (DUF1810 family)